MIIAVQVRGRYLKKTRMRVILCKSFRSTRIFTISEIIEILSPLVMKVRSRASSVMSGASTPGGGVYKSLSERDLQKADAALSSVGEKAAVNGVH